MWLALLIIAGAGLALVGTVVGIGFLAIPMVVLLVGGIVWLVSRKAAEQSGGATLTSGAAEPTPDGPPQDDEHSDEHARPGYAHPGQAHMTSEQLGRQPARR